MIVIWWILGGFFGAVILVSVIIGVIEKFEVKGVCFQCGFLKRNLLNTCPRCDFKPSTNEERAKSFILSTKEHHVGNIFPGKDLHELRKISQMIEQRKTYRFNSSEIKKVIKNF